MKKLIPIRVLILMLLFLLPVASCKKSGANGDSDEQTLTRLDAGNEGYFPFELIQLPLTGANVSDREVNTTINGLPLKITIKANTAIFTLPELPEAGYTVKFKADREFEFGIFVRKVAVVKTSEEYHKQSVDSFNGMLASLEATAKSDISSEDKAAIAADIVRFKAIFDEAEKAYATLSDEDKKEFARTMAGNEQWVGYLATYAMKETVLKIQSTDKKIAATNLDDFEAQQNNAIVQFLFAENTLSNNKRRLAAMLAIAPATLSIPVVGGPGTGVAVLYLLAKVILSVDRTAATSNQLLDVSFAPYDELTVDDDALKSYDNSEERIVSVQSRFRTLLSTDIGGSELAGSLKNLVSGIQSFKESFTEILAKVPNRFKPSVVLKNVRTNATTVKRSVSGAYLSITNITNAQVKVAFSKLANGAFKIIPTVTGNTDQQVSFDVTYSNPNFSNKLVKKTISTTVRYATDSTAYYKQLVLGSWTATNVESGETYNLIVQADGKLQYLFGSQTFKSTWEVIKVGKKYYFWEYGFWHDAYNTFRVYNKGFADEALKTPVTGFVHYNDLGGGKGPGAAIRYVKK